LSNVGSWIDDNREEEEEEEETDKKYGGYENMHNLQEAMEVSARV